MERGLGTPNSERGGIRRGDRWEGGVLRTRIPWKRGLWVRYPLVPSKNGERPLHHRNQDPVWEARCQSHYCVSAPVPCRQPLTEARRNLPTAAAIFSARRIRGTGGEDKADLRGRDWGGASAAGRGLGWSGGGGGEDVFPNFWQDFPRVSLRVGCVALIPRRKFLPWLLSNEMLRKTAPYF